MLDWTPGCPVYTRNFKCLNMQICIGNPTLNESVSLLHGKTQTTSILGRVGFLPNNLTFPVCDPSTFTVAEPGGWQRGRLGFVFLPVLLTVHCSVDSLNKATPGFRRRLWVQPPNCPPHCVPLGSLISATWNIEKHVVLFLHPG